MEYSMTDLAAADLISDQSEKTEKYTQKSAGLPAGQHGFRLQGISADIQKNSRKIVYLSRQNA